LQHPLRKFGVGYNVKVLRSWYYGPFEIDDEVTSSQKSLLRPAFRRATCPTVLLHSNRWVISHYCWLISRYFGVLPYCASCFSANVRRSSCGV